MNLNLDREISIRKSFLLGIRRSFLFFSEVTKSYERERIRSKG